MTQEKQVVTALNRLERAGNENSRTTAKLRESAVIIADKLVKTIEAAQCEEIELPRGYMVIDQRSNAGLFTQLRNADGETLNSESKIPGEHYLHGDFNRTWLNVGRDGLMQFAADIADGLLDEIAAFLESRAANDKTATATLETAI